MNFRPGELVRMREVRGRDLWRASARGGSFFKEEFGIKPKTILLYLGPCEPPHELYAGYTSKVLLGEQIFLAYTEYLDRIEND